MQIMRACLFACAFVWVSHSFSLILSICSSTLSMLHIIASTSRGLTHEVYRLSFILCPLFFSPPRSKLLVAGVVSVKLWDHSCMFSPSVLRGSPFLVLMALYKARAPGRSMPPLRGTAFNSHHATDRMACSIRATCSLFVLTCSVSNR